jgi:hypothetical protein
MVKQIKLGMNSMKSNIVAEFADITSKRDGAEQVLRARTESAQQKDREFTAATQAYETADEACTKAADAAVASDARLTTAVESFSSRSPVIAKEREVIRQLVAQVEQLKSINLQESTGQASKKRDAVMDQTRQTLLSLKTFASEAGSLTEMIEVAREHAEFTKPILELLAQLDEKLAKEHDSLSQAVTSAKAVNVEAQSTSKSVCDEKKAKLDEQ